MKYGFKKNVLILLLIVVTFALCAGDLFAELQIILNEHFDRNPEMHNWPWTTPAEDGEVYHWAANTQNWNTHLLMPKTPCGWGWQDHVFNSRVLQDEDYEGSLWCAFSTRDGPQNPQWPADDGQPIEYYWPNMNAWAIWGNFDLTDAVAGKVAYWIKIDMGAFSYDSLSVVAGAGDNAAVTDGDDFREVTPQGKSYNHNTGGDWQLHSVYFDSLTLDGEEFSIIGRDSCWVAFVWHSNNSLENGFGAFVDDIILAWDDGLMDIAPSEQKFGYEVNEDSTTWLSQQPKAYNEVYLGVNWEAVGSDELTPEFTISLFIDDDLFYSENREVLGNIDTTYFTQTDEMWYADTGSHVIRWEFDINDDVGESREGNNTIYQIVNIAWDPIPNFAILSPITGLSSVARNYDFDVDWTVADSASETTIFSVLFYWTKDTSGWIDDPIKMYEDYNYILEDFQYGEGEHTFKFDLNDYPEPELDDEGEKIHLPNTLTEGDQIYIVGSAVDESPGNTVYAIAPGYKTVGPVSAPGIDPFTPQDYSLANAYPNPFNKAISVVYTTPVAGDVLLRVFDLSGRQVETLVSGNVSAGSHTVSWSPNGVPGGVYMLQLDAGGHNFVRKAVYMP